MDNMIKNYFTKTNLAFRISRNIGTFLRLLSNSKKFGNMEKKGLIKADTGMIPIYNFKMNAKRFDVQMRTYSGDISIFYELFWKKMYALPHKLIQSPEIIIDLGAHLGFTSIFYALEYENAKIYSLEASKENFRLLKKNTEKFAQISVLNRAINFEDGEVLFEEGGLSYNTRISDKGDVIQAISIPTLMKNHKIHKIDLLKIDIEGAEKELLHQNNDWLEKVENIVIELHEPYDLQALKKDLEPFGFKIITPNNENGLKNILATKNLNNITVQE